MNTNKINVSYKVFNDIYYFLFKSHPLLEYDIVYQFYIVLKSLQN